jgi:hypothetical protein
MSWISKEDPTFPDFRGFFVNFQAAAWLIILMREPLNLLAELRVEMTSELSILDEKKQGWLVYNDHRQANNVSESGC